MFHSFGASGPLRICMNYSPQICLSIPRSCNFIYLGTVKTFLLSLPLLLHREIHSMQTKPTELLNDCIFGYIKFLCIIKKRIEIWEIFCRGYKYTFKLGDLLNLLLTHKQNVWRVIDIFILMKFYRDVDFCILIPSRFCLSAIEYKFPRCNGLNLQNIQTFGNI